MSESERTRLFLDPWSADYLPSIQAENGETVEGNIQVETGVETVQWAPIARKQAPPGSAAFVDGVRRIEARIVGLPPQGIVHGIFATFATGATVVTAGAATFAGCRTARTLILTSGLNRTETLRVGNTELRFEGLSVPDANPDSLLLKLQALMREAEELLARSLSTEVVFLDGPLPFFHEPPGLIVGVVKTIHRLYLGPGHMELVTRLRTGERTPLFAVMSEGRNDRYSWYLRIAERRSIHHGFSGVIRLEASAAGGIDAAVALADMSAAFLPRFASSANRDSRAPQNLTVVGALEEHLRNQMGDATLIQRAIEKRISEGLML